MREIVCVSVLSFLYLSGGDSRACLCVVIITIKNGSAKLKVWGGGTCACELVSRGHRGRVIKTQNERQSSMNRRSKEIIKKKKNTF